MADNRTKIAVLGGGLGAISAAFDLTATPALREQYELTVYQVGWRLGGKGASGRNLAAGARIEEHGLHMWLGFYAEAFRVMRKCYEEWGKVDFHTAFSPQYQISLGEYVKKSEEWTTWNIHVPVLPGIPGSHQHPSIVELLLFALKWLWDSWKKAHLDHSHPKGHQALMLAHDLAVSLLPDPDAHDPADHAKLRDHLDQARASISHGSARIGDDIDHQHKVILLDIAIAIATGFVQDILPYGNAGYDRINDLEFRNWLLNHGASVDAVRSAPIRALYAVGFAGQDAEAENAPPSDMAAGVAVRVLLHAILCSRKAPLFNMYAGMGDTVFTPFYEVLKARGVKFEFFSRVTELEVTPSGNLISGIKFDRQVELQPDIDSYDPLVPVKGLQCWPSKPKWSDIVDGQSIEASLLSRGITLESPECTQSVSSYTLELGRDFDQIVLGISIGALPPITQQLSTASESWKLMLDNVPTVGTMALQLWVTTDDLGLGWTSGRTVLTSYAEPLDSWADMSHLIDVEDWGKDANIKGIHYFCGALGVGDIITPIGPGSPKTFQQLATNFVSDAALSWLNTNVKYIWPKAVDDDGFKWSLLGDQDPVIRGPTKLEGQYIRANIAGSELYVLSTSGTTRYRLAPGDSDFDNLFLAGDWTKGTFEAGCVEAAVESGVTAAKEIVKTGT